MIIKATLRCPIYTQILEQYFKNGGCYVETYYKTEQDYKVFLECLKDYNNLKIRNPRKKILKNELEIIIKNNFINFLSTLSDDWYSERYTRVQDIKKMIPARVHIELVNLIIDNSKNNEVVYSFDFTRQYITI